MDQALAELICVDPLDDGVLLGLNLRALLRRDELGSACNIGTDVRQEFEGIAD